MKLNKLNKQVLIIGYINQILSRFYFDKVHSVSILIKEIIFF